MIIVQPVDDNNFFVEFVYFLAQIRHKKRTQWLKMAKNRQKPRKMAF